MSEVPASSTHPCRRCGSDVADRPRDGVCGFCHAPVAWSYLPRPVLLDSAGAIRWMRVGLVLTLCAGALWCAGVAYLALSVLRGDEPAFLPRVMLSAFLLAHAAWTGAVIALLLAPDQDADARPAGSTLLEALSCMVAIVSLGVTVVLLGAYERFRMGSDDELAGLMLVACLPAFAMPAFTAWTLTRWWIATLEGWCWMNAARRQRFAGAVLWVTAGLCAAGLVSAMLGLTVLQGGFEASRIAKFVWPLLAMCLTIQTFAGVLWAIEAVTLWRRMGVLGRGY